MKLLESYDEYTDMIREFREICKRPFSNLYCTPDDMKRYIQLGRVSYEKTANSIIFYFDEETYYRVCFYVDEKNKFTISPQNKKLLVRNVYKKKEKKENLRCVEEQLTELGFRNSGTTVGIHGEVQKLFQRCERIEKYEKALEKKGYRCIAADPSLFDEIDKIVVDSGVIKDYQIDYRTYEEKKNLEKGSYLCRVDSNNQICAVSVCVIKDGVAKGVATAVKEEYKMQGLAPVLTYHRFKWLRDNGIESLQAWILTSNEPSLWYHESLGYTFLSKYADEWILDAK